MAAPEDPAGGSTPQPASPARPGRALDQARRIAELEAALERAVRARDETLSTVSHDLKNPISALLLGVQRLARFADAARLEQALGVAERLERTLRSMTQLVEELVDLARLDAGRLSLERRPEAPGPLAARALAALAPLAAARQQALALSAPADLPEVLCDGERIVRVIASLVRNALQFSPPGSAVEVRLARAGRELVCSVADPGPGIAPEELAHLLDRHWRPPGGGRRHGLGLLVVLGYVEAHSGRVWAESQVGRGSTFSFALPLV